MADKTTTDLTAAAALADANLVAIVQGGNSRKATLTQWWTWITSKLAALTASAAFADADELVMLQSANSRKGTLTQLWTWIATKLTAGTAVTLGVNTAADATNKLAVRSNAALFTALNVGDTGDGDMQVKVNKEATGDDAGFIFQTGFSTRALFGLLADNDFSLKVSPDGSTFFTALTVDDATGKMTAGFGFNLTPTAGDLASPVNGDLWYNVSTGKFRARQAGTTVDAIGGAGVTDGDKGDVVVSGGGATWTLDNSILGRTIALNMGGHI